MLEKKVSDQLLVIDRFLDERAWFANACTKCGKTFYTKYPSQIDGPNCEWGACGVESLRFLTFSKRKQLLTPWQARDIIANCFEQFGFVTVAPQNISNIYGTTDLIIAGVQVFDPIIHRKQTIRLEKLFVAQPCVRMQFQHIVEMQEGTSTAFVNVCTERMSASLSDHLQAVDQWCTALSKLGLHMNDFAIVVRTSEKNWGTGDFMAVELFFLYGGLELGDAVYFAVPQEHRPPLMISDIGFGLERILWAVNKTESYYDLLTPLMSDGPREMFDTLRSLALLALSGVQASNKGSGLQFRRFAKVVAEKYIQEDTDQLLQHYYDYWAHFITPSVSSDSVVRLVKLEVERFFNLRINEHFKLPQPRNETTEEYLNRLVYTHNISIYELRKAIKACRS